MTIRLLIVVVLELKVMEVYANGFIRLSKSPVGTPRQAGKGLILPKDFLLADVGMVFHLCQCKHTVCVWETYLAIDNQASKTLERRFKRQFMARSQRSRMSPSRSLISIRITPIFWHQQLFYWSRLPSHPLMLQDCSSVITIAFDYASEVSITWLWRTNTHYL